MNFSFRSRLISIAGVVVLSLVSVQACSPGWTPDVFVRKYRPDVPVDFYAGKLGVLESTYFRFNLVAAYHYLNGGRLAANEVIPDHRWDYIYEGDPDSKSYAWNRAEADDDKQDDDGTAQWLAARNAAGAAKLATPVVTRALPGAQSSFVDSFVNCTPDAFATATTTLQSRAASWGRTNPLLADWLQGQDAVFSNCSDAGPGTKPVAAAASDPMLLQQDRAYQVAAAAFYAMDYAAARAGFQAISKDQRSPWKGIAALLVARTLVREAMVLSPPSKTGDVSFNADLLREAQQQLLALKKNNDVRASAVASELSYVEVRLDPNARIGAAAAALAGPMPDANFRTDLIDLIFLLDQRLDKDLYEPDAKGQRFETNADLRGLNPMVDWMVTFQSASDAARLHAMEQWRATHQLPWLVAAISKADPQDAGVAELLAAAEKVPDTSPGWQTVTYHRARLMGPGDAQQARQLLDATLERVKISGPASALNAFTGLRMTLATSLGDFLKYAQRKDLVASGQYAADAQNCNSCDKTIAPLQFDGDAAGFFNTQAPLSVWVEAAQSLLLPAAMQRALVLSGWTRAVMLKDDVATRAFAGLLPAGMRGQAGDASGLSTPEFGAWLTILRNPGLRVYVDAGVQRSQTAGTLDSLHDNWWIADWMKGAAPVGVVPVRFLTPAQMNEAKQQVQTLEAAGSASSWLGRCVLNYAKAHAGSDRGPGDLDVAEALHLVVRATRYGPADSAISGEAFRLLHRDYAKSVWAAKTPYSF